MNSVQPPRLGAALATEVRDRIPGLGQVLVSQARRRMVKSGDSEHRYPDLWNHPGSRRTGELPLLDRGLMSAALSGKDERTEDGQKSTLVGTMVAVYHQHGYKTKGPNFIPLTLAAARAHQPGANPRDEGLVPWDDETKEGDYVMAWRGVTVPQRKIFNLPPEDVQEIGETIAQAIAQG